MTVLCCISGWGAWVQFHLPSGFGWVFLQPAILRPQPGRREGALPKGHREAGPSTTRKGRFHVVSWNKAPSNFWMNENKCVRNNQSVQLYITLHERADTNYTVCILPAFRAVPSLWRLLWRPMWLSTVLWTTTRRSTGRPSPSPSGTTYTSWSVTTKTGG